MTDETEDIKYKKTLAKCIRHLVDELNQLTKEAHQKEMMVEINMIDIRDIGTPKPVPQLYVIVTEEVR